MQDTELHKTGEEKKSLEKEWGGKENTPVC